MRTKLPTIKEIAKQLNISVSTVSRALKNHPDIGLRTTARVQELAKQLEYVPNQTALFFQQGKTYTIGVILPALAEAFFSTAISAIEDAAETGKYSVLFGQSHDNFEREKKIVETMKNHRVDGLLVSISKNTFEYGHFESLRKLKIPIVYFDRIPNLPDINFVSCNIAIGTEQAINYLVGKGHRNIGMINGPEKLFASQEREQAYRAAMNKNHLTLIPNSVVNSDLTMESTQVAMVKLLKPARKPTAILVFNYYVAMDAIKCSIFTRARTRKPICFVSYANLPISEYSAYPPAATIEQYPYLQGQKATEMLLELLSEKHEDIYPTNYKIILDSKLVVYDVKQASAADESRQGTRKDPDQASF